MMNFIIILDVIGWILVIAGWSLNFSNAKNPSEEKSIAALVCFCIALVLFLITIFASVSLLI